jgi:hypothetical protein
MTDALSQKLQATAATCRGLPRAMRLEVATRMIAGHEEHGDDLQGLDVVAEAREELADVIGYAALARLTGQWSWRWSVAVLLAGLAWRVMGSVRIAADV